MQLSKRVYHEIDEDEVFTRSAALAFYFVSALVPMVFFLMAILGLLAQGHDLQSGLLGYTGRFMPPDAYTLLQKTLKEITTNSTGLKLAIGLVLALWSGSGGVSSIMDALNRCYHVKDSRPYWKQKLIAIGLTIALSALTVTALIIILYGGDIAQFVGNHTGMSTPLVMAWQIVQWPVAFFFVVLSFALLYSGARTRNRIGNGSRPAPWWECCCGSAFRCSSACTCTTSTATAKPMDRWAR